MDAQELAQRIQRGGFLPLTIDPLQNILLDIMALIKNQNDRLDNMDQKIDRKADNEVLTALSQTVDKNAKLCADRDAGLESQLGALKDSINSLEKGLKEQADKLDAVQQSVNDVNHKLDDTNNMVAQNTGRIEALEEALRNLKSEVGGIDRSVIGKDLSPVPLGEDSNEASNDSTEDQKQVISEQNLEQLEDVKQLKEDIEQLGDVKQLKQNLEQLGDVKQLKEGIEQLGNIKQLKDDVSKLGDLTQRVDNLEKEVERLRKELGNVGDDLHNIGDALANNNMDVKITTGDSKSQEIEAKLSELGSQLDLLRSTSDAKIRDLEGKTTATDNQLTGLRSNVQGLEHRVADIDDRTRQQAQVRAVSPLPHGEGSASASKTETVVRERSVPASAETAGTAAVTTPRKPTPPSTEAPRRGRMPLPDLTSPENKEAIAQLRAELTSLQQTVTDNAAKTQDQIASLGPLTDKIAAIERDLADRPDRAMIERLFDKFKSSIANVADMIKNKNAADDGSGYATKEDLKKIEQQMLSITNDFEEAACARKSTCCLSCGRPYRQVTGAIQDELTLSVLGAAPISHINNDTTKCFVYGSDHELYYSSSPRGRTFVAPSSPRSPTKQ